MKYIPFKNQPNVSRTRYPSLSPSMKLDNRGFPHISWIEEKNGRNEIKYSFWDGLKWSYLSQSQIYISEEDVKSSPNSIILDSEEDPIIVFSRDMIYGSRISVASHDGTWIFNDIDVTYSIGWVGIVSKEQSIDSSSSSSDQSGTSDLYYVVVYDITNAEFKVYGVGSSLNLVGSISESNNSFSSVRIDFCNFKIAISYVEDGSDIKYNFFDTVTNSWSFGSFNSLSPSLLYGDIREIDIVGYSSYGNEKFCIGWLSETTDASYVNSALCFSDGSEAPVNGVSYNVESSPFYISPSVSGYIVNGYKKIGVTLGDGGEPIIVCLGVSSKEFIYDGVSSWDVDQIDLGAVSNGNVFLYLNIDFVSGIKIVFGSDSGDIYCFTSSLEESFPVANPDIFILNEGYYAYRLTDFSGSVGEYIGGLYNNFYGASLRDAKSPLMIVSNLDMSASSSSSSSGDG